MYAIFDDFQAFNASCRWIGEWTFYHKETVMLFRYYWRRIGAIIYVSLSIVTPWARSLAKPKTYFENTVYALQFHIPTTSLSQAASRNELQEVMRLIDQGQSVSERDSYGYTALHYAAEYNCIDVARCLINHGALVNDDTNDSGPKPLHVAALKGHTEMISFLIQSGARSFLLDGVGYEPIHLAARSGNRQAVEVLLQAGASVDVQDDNDEGLMPMHCAAESGSVAVMDYLHTEGADVMENTPDHEQPIHRAAAQNRQAAIEWLLQREVPVDTRDGNGATPLHRAAQYGAREAVVTLLNHGASMNTTDVSENLPIAYAAHEGYIDIVNLLIQAGFSVNARCCAEYTLMEIAIQIGNKELVEWLAAHGASLAITYADGHSPLSLACKYGHLEIVKWIRAQHETLFNNLRRRAAEIMLDVAAGGHLAVFIYLHEHGFPVNSGSSDYAVKPIHQAAKGGHLELVRWLTDHDVSLETQDRDNLSAVHYAAEGGNTQMLEFILTKAPHLINQDDSTGWTPILHAAYGGSIAAFENLIKVGANSSACAEDGAAVLHCAARGGHVALIEHLLLAGHEINQQTIDRQTPLDIAKSEAHDEAIVVLERHGAKSGCKLPRYSKEQLSDVRSTGLTSNTTILQNRPEIREHLSALRFCRERIESLSSFYLHPQLHLRQQLQLISSPTQKACVEILNNKNISEWESSSVQGVRWLGLTGAQINTLDEGGAGLLHYAAAKGNPEMILLLSSRWAQIHKRDRYGLQPIHWAAALSEIAAIVTLLELEADINAESTNGLLPVHMAAFEGNDSVLRFLIEMGALLEAGDRALSPIECALLGLMEQPENNNVENFESCIRLLLAKQTIPPEMHGDLLVLAVRTGSTSVLKLLLLGNCSVNALSRQGMTALRAAVYTGNSDMVKFLLNSGANVSVDIVREMTQQSIHNDIRVLLEINDSSDQSNEFITYRENASTDCHTGVFTARRTEGEGNDFALSSNNSTNLHPPQQFERFS